MSCGRSDAYATPLGLITSTPASRSTPLALPNDSVTSPAVTRSRFAWQTWSRSDVRDNSGPSGAADSTMRRVSARADYPRRQPATGTASTIGLTTLINDSIVSWSYGAGSSAMNVSKPTLR